MTKKDRFAKGQLKDNRGFTLIEVVSVLTVLAILGAVFISRGMVSNEFKVHAEVDTLKSHLRFAQYRAMNDLPLTQWGISIGGSSYTLIRVDANGTTSPLNLPGESSATHSFSPISADADTVLFDSWGSPGNGPVTLTLGGETITITANTGFIP